jgi:hypothetical protein
MSAAVIWSTYQQETGTEEPEMTYVERKVAEYQAAATRLTTQAQATRRIRTLEGQMKRARESVSRAEGRRRMAGGRLQSSAEVKARARVSDLQVELHVVREHLLELDD